MKRSQPISNWQLFEFIKDTDRETLDRVADSIPYEDRRVLFRDYCRMVKDFMEKNGIEKMQRDTETIEIELVLTKTKVLTPKGENPTVAKIKLDEHFNSELRIELIKTNGEEITTFNLRDIERDAETFMLFQQLEQHIRKGVKKFKEKLDQQTEKVGEEFISKLKERFSPYLVAEQL